MSSLLERFMIEYEFAGYCSRHNKTSRVIDGPERLPGIEGFYVIYDCCQKEGNPKKLRTEYILKQ